MRKLPARYRAGQSNISATAQDDDDNLVKAPTKITSLPAAVPSIKVGCTFSRTLLFFFYVIFVLAAWCGGWCCAEAWR
jgi:hypothetical protein